MSEPRVSLATLFLVIGLTGSAAWAVSSAVYGPRADDLRQIERRLDLISQQIASYEAAQAAHVSLEGHPGMQRRIRELERALP